MDKLLISLDLKSLFI